MMAKIENKIPVVRYREEPPSIEGIAHELLHLKLEYEGYHLLLPPEQDRLISQTAVILQNVMHHHIIFPILERWGYNPRQGECCGTKNQLCILREADFNRLNNEQSLCSLFAMVYVRGMLDCNDINIQENLIHVFDDAMLQGARQMAEFIIQMIGSFVDISAAGYKSALNDCIVCLGLNADIEIANHI